MGKILIDSETDLKSSKEESLHIGKQLTNALRQNLALQKEVIQTSNQLTDAHTQYATRLEGFASAIVGSRDRIIELEAEITQLKKDLPKRD
jgi:predicted  nucleic acid-binding Zn-ribbon protein